MASARDVYDAVLVELNKNQVQNLLLEDFNYLFNKAAYQYINKKYAVYDTNQQSTDDLRVLKATIHLTPAQVETAGADGDLKAAIKALYDKTYEVKLPLDYMHVLNCICSFKVKSNYKCYDKDLYVLFPAIRLTADTWAIVINNFYMRPSYKRPYFYIHNNKEGSLASEDDGRYKYKADTKNPEQEEFTLGGGKNLRRTNTEATTRVGNADPVRMEIRCGKDDSVFQLVDVQVDYIKVPQHIRLTLEQIEETIDKSQIIEWPDYVVQEIINELVHIIMEHDSDPRLQTHIPISTTIAPPAQQLAKSK